VCAEGWSVGVCDVSSESCYEFVCVEASCYESFFFGVLGVVGVGSYYVS
jgi:hypothetical protein